jgi:hypothetical protein
MGGAPVYVEADGIFVGKADFAARHQVLWGDVFGDVGGLLMSFYKRFPEGTIYSC